MPGVLSILFLNCISGDLRQFLDGISGYLLAIVIHQIFGLTGEYIGGFIFSQLDDSVFRGNLQRIFNIDPHSFADLDGKYNPSQLVDLSDDTGWAGISFGYDGTNLIVKTTGNGAIIKTLTPTIAGVDFRKKFIHNFFLIFDSIKIVKYLRTVYCNTFRIFIITVGRIIR